MTSDSSTPLIHSEISRTSHGYLLYRYLLLLPVIYIYIMEVQQDQDHHQHQQQHQQQQDQQQQHQQQQQQQPQQQQNQHDVKRQSLSSKVNIRFINAHISDEKLNQEELLLVHFINAVGCKNY